MKYEMLGVVRATGGLLLLGSAALIGVPHTISAVEVSNQIVTATMAEEASSWIGDEPQTIMWGSEARNERRRRHSDVEFIEVGLGGSLVGAALMKDGLAIIRRKKDVEETA